MSDMESIARKVLELWPDGPVDDVVALLHPDVSIAPKAASGEVLQGREEVRAWLAASREWAVYRVRPSTFSLLRDDVVLVKGRIQWMSNGILSDSPCVWLIEFEDGLVRRSRTFDSVSAARSASAATADETT
jgi:ketosteroid isomerase-like protein